MYGAALSSPNDKVSWPCQRQGMPEIKTGQKIVVFNGQRQELGEGTFVRLTRHMEMNLIAYECEEHTILAHGEHFLSIEGEMYAIQSGLET